MKSEIFGQCVSITYDTGESYVEVTRNANNVGTITKLRTKTNDAYSEIGEVEVEELSSILKDFNDRYRVFNKLFN